MARNRHLLMDARMLSAEGTGVATYARALRRAQRTIDPAAGLLAGPAPLRAASLRRGLRATLPFPVGADADADGFRSPDLFRVGHLHFTLYGKLLPVRVPGPAGLMHWSYPVPLRIVGWRNLYTVHDAIPLTHPGLTGIDGARHRRVLAQILRTADRIVTVSDAARSDIVRALGCDPARIENCAQPVDVAGPGALPEGLAPGGYLLVCGTVEPRKNIARLLRAYRASGTALPLVLAGPADRTADLEPLVAATPGVRRIARVDRPTMLALLKNACALLMPSLAEGFGLPVAEAMALGTPVLASQAGALAETAGGAALSVDPGDADAIATGIARIAGDGALRSALVARGRARAAAFTPDLFARRLDALYAQVFAGSEGSS